MPRGSLLLQAEQPVRQDSEYERHGVANLFLALEPLRGWRKVRGTDRRTRRDFAEQRRQRADEDSPQAERIVLVVENLNTHGPGALRRPLRRKKRIVWRRASNGITPRNMAAG